MLRNVNYSRWVYNTFLISSHPQLGSVEPYMRARKLIIVVIQNN